MAAATGLAMAFAALVASPAGAEIDVDVSEACSAPADGSTMFLDVWLWHFGPPQRFYGEPTPVQYRYGGYQPTEIAPWSGHSAQAEVTVLGPPVPGMAEQDTDSRRFAARLRQAAAENTDEDSGPMLEFETWSGVTADARGSSQGTIEFDLLGVERAAFPVLDACGA